MIQFGRLETMSHQREFNRILDRLYERRSDKLRHLLARKHGPLLTLTKKKRESKILELQEIVSKALAKKMARTEFAKVVHGRRTWRSKGWGTDKKKSIFRAWVLKRVSPKRGKVYIFWRKRECRYVGRTRGRGTRPSRHFKRGWFNGTTRIDVYLTRQKRTVPRLECLAIHRFRPTRNKVKAAAEGWTLKCPLCAAHKEIRTELRKIYQFR
jgi:hypothetical protein